MESLLDEIESQHASQRRPGPPLDGADVSSSGVKRKRSHRDDEERFSREREEEHEGSMEGDRVDRTAQACSGWSEIVRASFAADSQPRLQYAAGSSK